MRYPADMGECMSVLWAQDLGPGTYRFQDAPQPAKPAAKVAPEPQPDPEDLI